MLERAIMAASGCQSHNPAYSGSFFARASDVPDWNGHICAKALNPAVDPQERKIGMSETSGSPKLLMTGDRGQNSNPVIAGTDIFYVHAPGFLPSSPPAIEPRDARSPLWHMGTQSRHQTHPSASLRTLKWSCSVLRRVPAIKRREVSP